MFYVTDENGNPIPIAGTGANPNLDCLRMKVLWTNPTPNVAYAGGTITLPSTDYEFFDIEYKYYINSTYINTSMIMRTSTLNTVLTSNNTTGSGALVFKRELTISGNTVTIGAGYSATGNSAGTTDNNCLVPIRIYGVLKTPAMIYTGEELFEGANVNINNGVISVKQLVADVTFGSASSFEITDLDLQGDGGVYDIIIEPPITSAQSNFKFRLNNNSSSSAYVHSFFDIDPQSKTLTIGSQSTSDGWAYLGAYGPNPNSIFMTLMSSQGRAIWTIDTVGYLGRLDFEKFFGYTVTANVTSMQILANSTLSAGLKVKIYRRLS